MGCCFLAQSFNIEKHPSPVVSLAKLISPIKKLLKWMLSPPTLTCGFKKAKKFTPMILYVIKSKSIKKKMFLIDGNVLMKTLNSLFKNVIFLTALIILNTWIQLAKEFTHLIASMFGSSKIPSPIQLKTIITVSNMFQNFLTNCIGPFAMK